MKFFVEVCELWFELSLGFLGKTIVHNQGNVTEVQKQKTETKTKFEKLEYYQHCSISKANRNATHLIHQSEPK